MSNELIPVELIENKIFIIRGYRVMLDYHLAELYDVDIRTLNRKVRGNIKRFPKDFMFQLTDIERDSLKSQITIQEGNNFNNPCVFTKHGLVMLSNVLDSKKAIALSIYVVNFLVRLKTLDLTENELTIQLNNFEQGLIDYAKDTTLLQQEQHKDIKEILEYLQCLIGTHKPEKIWVSNN